MYRVIVLCAALLMITPSAFAACANGARYAGCAGPNGVATYNKSSGQAHSYNANTGRTNSATRAVQSGCAWVNGRRVCR
jgi:hypothetical protein